MTINELKDVWAEFISAESYLLACHIRPDGDTLGSALGVARALRIMGKDVTVISADGVPENYDFLPESETVVTTTERRDFDMGVLIDSEGLSRVGRVSSIIESAKKHACIDHHEPLDSFGTVRIVDSTASATAELVYELFEANGVQIDPVCATQLLTGIISDTGGFRFANTKSRTFHIASMLTSLGAEPAAISRKVYSSRPLRAAKLLGRALTNIRTEPTGKVLWSVISKSDLDEFSATDEDTDSIVNHVEMVKGPAVIMLFRETGPDTIRVSLRSRDGVDVNEVARKFGGGGHKAAAGCTVDLPLSQAEKAVVDEALKWMDS